MPTGKHFLITPDRRGRKQHDAARARNGAGAMIWGKHTRGAAAAAPAERLQLCGLRRAHPHGGSVGPLQHEHRPVQEEQALGAALCR